jgi:hypothetical protein
MLDWATAGKRYSKADLIRVARGEAAGYGHNRDDFESCLENRSRGSVEAKLMNASAAHRDLINEHIAQFDSEPLYRDTMATYGYKAWGNYQATLKAEMASIINRRITARSAALALTKCIQWAVLITSRNLRCDYSAPET